ncbi:hypothetical protein ACFYVR_24915 [Rhodococcus sp. NPDC003318]|uniref:hypothetical protein n=1 Tax=Rhodococcus sp. NPDC003318 TaxID=3364503 RepID=UPI0036CAA361
MPTPYPAGVVTHSTAVIAGDQTADIAVYEARTDRARLTVTIGYLMMTFTSAHTVQRVLEGFAAVKAAMMGLDNRAPERTPEGAQFAHNALAVTWVYPPTYSVVRGKGYLGRERRTVYWVDVHMGPITWRITDHVGYEDLLAHMKNAHKTAVAIFPDGPKFRKDPTKAPRDAFAD